jgi:hypothetical protein
MPQIIDAHASAKNPLVIEAAKGALQAFAATVLVETAIVAPTPGYKAYNKRVAFAALAIHNPALYAEQAAVYVEQVSNGSVAEAQATNVPLFNYLQGQNPSTFNFFEVDATQRASLNNVGRTSGNSIFDVLAGVNAGDLL